MDTSTMVPEIKEGEDSAEREGCCMEDCCEFCCGEHCSADMPMKKE